MNTLRYGVVLSLVIGLAGSAAVGEPTQSKPPQVEIFIEVVAASAAVAQRDEPLILLLERVKPVAVDDDDEAVRFVEVSIDQRLRVGLPKATSWRLRLEEDGLWTPGAVINALDEHAGKTVSLRLWPTATLLIEAGSTATGHFQPLDELWLRLEPPRALARPNDVPPVSIRCGEPKSRGRFECVVPAAEVDLALRPPAYVPKYLWNTQLAPGEERDLARIVFREGSSLSGWVERVDGEAIEPEAVDLTLWPSGAGSPDADVGARLQRQQLEALALDGGFFQFKGVEPGAYRIVAEHPDFATTTTDAIWVRHDAETQLGEPIVLAPPLSLEVLVDPPLDFFGRGWTLRLIYFGDTLPPGVDEWEQLADVDESGLAILKSLVPGSYNLVLKDTLGNVLHTQMLDLSSGTEPFRFIEVDLIEVEGRLLLDDDPLGGRLVFNGPGDATIELDADEMGRFSGYLAGEGRARVSVRSESPRLERTLLVEVEALDGRVWLDLDLPAGRLFGRVIDKNGNPLAGATIHAMGGGGRSTVVSDVEGEFDLLALAPGTYDLGARFESAGGERMNAAMAVELAEDSAFGPVELVLTSQVSIEVRVSGRHGAVAGAEVFVQSDEFSAPGRDAGRTGAAGTTTISLPSNARYLSGFVAAPGYGLQPFSAEMGRRQTLNLSIGEHSGQIDLQLDPDSPEIEFAALVADGIVLPIAALSHWAMTAPGGSTDLGGHFVLPALAPGHYELCTARLGSELASMPNLSSWLSTVGNCVAGDLEAGGELRLDLASE